MDTLLKLLDASQAGPGHLCPSQVLGVRIGLAGLSLLQIDPTTCRKNLLVIVETDGCFVNGIEVTTKVSVSQRSLKIEDYGKIAATFVHLKSGREAWGGETPTCMACAGYTYYHSIKEYVGLEPV